MTLIILGPILATLATFLLSFLEAGALFGSKPRGEQDSDASREGNDPNLESMEGAPRQADTGTVVAAMVIFRAQIIIAFSVLIGESLLEHKELNLHLMSTLFTSAYVLAEVVGKVIAIRHPARAQRAARPLHKLLARVRPTWFRFGR